MKKEESFKTSPRILSHLGEDLIKDDSIALLELVKNAYDACALNCMINFIYDNDNIEKITILDDGKGMNYDIIKNVWLVIGTDNKLNINEPNECGRLPLGEKGVGRLGVHKLGNKVTIISKTINSNEMELHIDWTKLSSVNEINDFKIEVYENDKPKKFLNSSGTYIIIEKIKSKWDRVKLREIYRVLTTLHSPFEHKSDSFNVKVTINNDFFDNISSYEDIREMGIYQARCKLQGDTISYFDYRFIPWMKLDKVKSGRIVSLSDLKNKFNGLKIKDSNGKIINLDTFNIGPVEIILTIFETENYLLSYSNIEKKVYKNYLRENGGIRVYRDNMRVYNYGEKGNDWLDLDLKRVSRVGGHISNNIVIGAILLERKSSKGLREKTNREGFIENDSYYALKNAVSYIVSLIEIERNIDKEHLKMLYKGKLSKEPVLADIKEIVDLVNKSITDKKTKQDILHYINRITVNYNNVKDVLLKSANLGLNVGIIIHELEKQVINLMNSIKNNNYTFIADIASNIENIVNGYTSLIRKSSFEMVHLSKLVCEVVSNLTFRFSDHNIVICGNYKNSTLQAYISSPEVKSMIINIIDNSIFWLCQSRQDNRKISINLSDFMEGYSSIILSDNGPDFTIPIDIITSPFTTGKPNNMGMGLGLHIVSEMITKMGGKILFLSSDYDSIPKELDGSDINKAIVVLCFPNKKH